MKPLHQNAKMGVLGQLKEIHSGIPLYLQLNHQLRWHLGKLREVDLNPHLLGFVDSCIQICKSFLCRGSRNQPAVEIHNMVNTTEVTGMLSQNGIP